MSLWSIRLRARRRSPALLFWGWYSRFYHPDKLERTVIFATLFLILYAGLPVLRAVRFSGLKELDSLVILANSALYFAALYAMLWPQDRWPLTLLVLALSAAHLVVARLQLLVPGSAGGRLDGGDDQAQHIDRSSQLPAMAGEPDQSDYERLRTAWRGRWGTDGFEARWRESPGGQELKRVRNIKPGFKRGLWLGLANAALETATTGRSPWTLRHKPDHEQLHTLQEQAPVERHWQDRTLPPRDRLASVFFAGTTHEESQPVHLKVRDPSLCAGRCAREFGNPCQRFCPANVYEMVDDGQGGKRLQINAANCVHCKACDIKDPYGVIDWTTPEGGSGPNYQAL